MTEEEAYYRQAPDTTLGMPERNGRAPAEAESNKFLSRLLTPAQLVEMEPPKFLVDGMIRQSGLGLVWGPYGSTKSFLTLELAASIGGGLPWQGRATVLAKVGYVIHEWLQQVK